MYNLQVLMEILIDDYDLLVNGVDSDGIHFTMEFGMFTEDVDRYMQDVVSFDDDFAGMKWRIYHVEGNEYFIEVY